MLVRFLAVLNFVLLPVFITHLLLRISQKLILRRRKSQFFRNDPLIYKLKINW